MKQSHSLEGHAEQREDGGVHHGVQDLHADHGRPVGTALRFHGKKRVLGFRFQLSVMQMLEPAALICISEFGVWSLRSPVQQSHGHHGASDSCLTLAHLQRIHSV